MTPQLLSIFFIIIFSTISTLVVITNAENDFRYISYQDLLPSSDRFTDGNVTSFSRLLFDVSRDQVIVGARDTLYRMSFSLKPREKSIWEATSTMMETCQDKGQSEIACHNYIMVLQAYGNGKLYACGTYAFSPYCSWRQMENLNVTQYDKGVAKCPFNPNSNITTLMTNSGHMFVGLATDFSGSDPVIARADVAEEGKRMLRTSQYDSKWLSEPQFVGSFEAGDFIYFIFREPAVEYINCGKIIYSRIARVCKSDPGGDRINKDIWTSYVKARLNCSLSGDYPFYFDEIQGVEYSSEEGVLYATFTTPENSIHGSAICSFNMSSITAGFNGPFKHQETINSAWERHDTTYRANYECKLGNIHSAIAISNNNNQHHGGTFRHSQFLDASRYQLMDQAVQPTTVNPLHYSKLERFTHIALDMISTKLHENVRIMYVATESGLIKKIAVLPRTKETCIIEIWQPEIQPIYRIKTMQFLKETESIYIGTEVALMRISAQHCSRHVSRSSCLNSMDPYCGWNELRDACTAPPNGDTLARYWIQNATDCPILTAPVDGGWSAWSNWDECTLANGLPQQQQQQQQQQQMNGMGGSIGTDGDTCLCQTRACNNPSPRNGGQNCNGMHIAVTNCTVHGGWTEWSAWSACSQTCGMAVKTRRRTCGNPKPANGGRVCVGTNRDELYCTHLPPCPVPKEPPTEGGWGPWGPWGECSSPCGGGYRIKRRKCDDPAPQNGGMECAGCHLDYEICNTHACAESKKFGSWTPWMMQVNGSTGDGGHLERRFRFQCKANVADSNNLKVSLAKEETRVCHSDGSCQRAGEGGDEPGWTDWGPWSTCSEECGSGQQFRTRTCERGTTCEGTAKMARACNTHQCQGEWGCWTDWTPCSVSCGIGKRSRTRQCLSNGNSLYGSGCDGDSIETDTCEMPNCDSFLGWSSWSSWSLCNIEGERSRYRKCLTTNPEAYECQGSESETRECIPPMMANETIQSASMNVITITIIFAFLLIATLTGAVFGTAFFMKRRFINTNGGNVYNGTLREVKNMGSPCFDSFPNQYSSLPTKDDRQLTKVKRQSSFNSNANCTANVTQKLLTNGHAGGHHGTLTKTNNVNSNNTPKVLSKSNVDIDTATIKRNSHGLNNSRTMRSIDDDKF